MAASPEEFRSDLFITIHHSEAARPRTESADVQRLFKKTDWKAKFVNSHPDFLLKLLLTKSFFLFKFNVTAGMTVTSSAAIRPVLFS